MKGTALSPPLLRVEPAGQPCGAVLRCAGEIDLSNVACLEQELAASIRLRLPVIEVDLRDVSFLDSSTMAALIRAQSELRRSGGRLRVRARPSTAHLFQLLRIDQVFELLTE
jgi:anti-anti-sigma factor